MFKVSPLFCDHAILPVGKELRIFGTADKGEKVCARLTDADGVILGEGQSVAREGRFLIHLPPQQANAGKLTLTVSSDGQTWTAADLRMGLVFMAGGQSNMEWGLWNAEGGQEIIKTHADDELRYFNVPRVSVLDEAGIAAHEAAHWQRIEPHAGGDMSAVAYFFAREVRAKTGLPVGIVGCNWGGTSILSWMDEVALSRSGPAMKAAEEYERKHGDITLKEWQDRQKAFEGIMDQWNIKVAKIREDNPGIEYPDLVRKAGECPWNPPPGPGSPYRPGQLHRTMVETIVPMALTGILFYQGESDEERAELYGDLLITLVTRWRELFGDAELPFCNVQLPMFIAPDAEDNCRWAILRQQQEKAWKTLRNSGLAVLIDGGEYGNIHPLDKVTPGTRLAQVYLGEAEQPWALAKSTSGNVLTVTLTHPVHGEGSLFEIAGADGVYVPAAAELDGCSIRLTAEGVAHPVKARYAWINWAKVQVFGESGLPLAPFVLDN